MAKHKYHNDDGPRLFKENLVPADPGADEFFKTEYDGGRGRAVECLGMTFPTDEKRREYFLDKLREKLKDPEFRKIEGFPIGADEDILALSDPPYYTACPNPFLADVLRCWQNRKSKIKNQKSYSREPFAVDVSEGKTHPVYKAHSYHTKVPHLAIVPSILHYTEPGDLVLDGFAGSGMTGVAAQWCGASPPDYRMQLEQHWQDEGHPPPVWGARRCVLNDLAPAATFIAANYNLPFDVGAFARAARQLLKETEREIGWMYETTHTDGKTKGRIEYTVWSEVFTCPECAGEIVFLDEALDEETKRVKESFPCPHCHADVGKRSLDKAFETKLDAVTGETIQSPKRKPSLICYRVGKAKFEKKPDAADLAILAKIVDMALPPEVPAIGFPFDVDAGLE